MLMQLCTLALPMVHLAGLPQREGGQQGLYNFSKMKWQTCGKHSES